MTEVLRGFLQIVAGMAALFVLVGAAKWLEDDPTIVMTATDRAVFFVSLTGLVSACAGLRLDSLHRTVPREDA
jgi:hypothetical protein